MTRMPTITAKVLIKFLNNLGFKPVRQKGSHKFFKPSDGRTATVPDHRGEELGRGITNKILKDIEVTREEFINWHQKQ
ncbi:MAG: type II toxin-antitoxin system HicA family toxin [Thermodesulfobacteriota bacterium]